MKNDWLNVCEHGVSGSEFETRGRTEAGSVRVEVESPGDFLPGQEVSLSGCHVHFDQICKRPVKSAYLTNPPIPGEFELRGDNSSESSWVVFMVEIDGRNPLTFRWSDDLGLSWGGEQVPVTGDWQDLSHGVQFRFLLKEWMPGEMITFHARDELFTTIEAIEGNTLVLRQAPNMTASDVLVRHIDQTALQAVVDRAIKDDRNVYLPPGRYRLTCGLAVHNARSITIEGGCAETTILDISLGTGYIFHLTDGKEVNLRNLSLVGHTGMNESNSRGMQTAGGGGFFPFSLKPCRALVVNGTERVFSENLHASRMASECFYSQGPNRENIDYHWGKTDNKRVGYTREWTFLRCSVTDCNFNAFNNNDIAENTSILYCYVENIGGCTWEGPARFIRFIGNTVKNGGSCSIGNMSHRLDFLEQFGCGQSIFADNVFEGHHWHRRAIQIAHAASHVIIRNNIFVNYNGTAIRASSQTMSFSFPSEIVTITGNIIDLTAIEGPPISRIGIEVNTSHAVVSDNQIFVRGGADPQVDGIVLHEPAVNVSVHNNLIRHCRRGLAAARLQGIVSEVCGPDQFKEYHPGFPLEWEHSHCYRGWRTRWPGTGDELPSETAMERFDPKTCRFILAEPRELRPGDTFEMQPDSANWMLQGNTITGCLIPVDLGTTGSDTSVLRNNTIERGDAEGVSTALTVCGRFLILDNLLCGFDEPGSSAMLIKSDPHRSIGSEGTVVEGNRCVRCTTSASHLEPSAVRPKWRVPRLDAAPPLNNTAHNWPWDNARRVIAFNTDLNGHTVPSLHGRAIAGLAANTLCVAAQFTVPAGVELAAEPNWGKGDGMAIVFRSAIAERRSPVFQFWGSVDGRMRIDRTGGLKHEERNVLQNSTTYRLETSNGQWSCEWRIPLDTMGMDSALDTRLRFNIGLRSSVADTWIVWVPTGEYVYFGYPPMHADLAGDLLFIPPKSEKA